jgi:CheY-like chemotaxis protein
MDSGAPERELVIGAVDCHRLALYSSFFAKRGYALTHAPGSECAVLVACADHLAAPEIAAWGRRLAGPKFVLAAAPPADWSDTVRLDLPLLPVTLEQRILAAHSPRQAAAEHHAYDVVLVDDDATVRSAAAVAFGALGLSVRACSGFADLTGALLEARPDFIVLDLNLPGISGESLGNIIRKRAIPTALFSSLPLEEIEATQGKIGGVKAFSKTSSLASIGRWIRQYLDGRAQ